MSNKAGSVLVLAAAVSGCVGQINGSSGAGDLEGTGDTSATNGGSGGTTPPDVVPVDRNGRPPLPATTFDPRFACGSADPLTALIASTVRRIPKIHFVNAIDEFLSQMSAANRTAVMKGLQTKFDILPMDVPPSKEAAKYTNGDVTLDASRVDAVYDIGFELGQVLAAGDTYVNDLVKVCGAGSTRASLSNAACLDTFVGYYARKALRRPASAAELADFKSDHAASGLGLLLGRLILHPRFYYRFDNDGTKVGGQDGIDAVYKLTNYELVSKITFLFWSRPPDDTLYDMAAAADLESSGGLDQVLDHVLTSPFARDGIRDFYSQWLEAEQIPSLSGMKAPGFATLAAGENVAFAREHMIEEVLDMVEHYTLNTAGRYEDLLTNQYSFAKAGDVAKLYGTDVWSGQVDGLVPIPADKPRTGLLARAAFLISGTQYTRPVIKGKKIRLNILCDSVPSAPGNILAQVNDAVAAVEGGEDRTTRQILFEQIDSKPACAACHGTMNPLGYLTEDYDSLGRYRTEETRYSATSGAVTSTLPIQTQAAPALYDDDTAVLQDSLDLGQYIAQSGKGHQCLVKQYFRYAYSRAEDEARDGCGLEQMRARLMGGSGNLVEMFKETTRQDSFRQRKVM